MAAITGRRRCSDSNVADGWTLLRMLSDSQADEHLDKESKSALAASCYTAALMQPLTTAKPSSAM